MRSPIPRLAGLVLVCVLGGCTRDATTPAAAEGPVVAAVALVLPDGVAQPAPPPAASLRLDALRSAELLRDGGSVVVAFATPDGRTLHAFRCWRNGSRYAGALVVAVGPGIPADAPDAAARLVDAGYLSDEAITALLQRPDGRARLATADASFRAALWSLLRAKYDDATLLEATEAATSDAWIPAEHTRLPQREFVSLVTLLTLLVERLPPVSPKRSI